MLFLAELKLAQAQAVLLFGLIFRPGSRCTSIKLDLGSDHLQDIMTTCVGYIVLYWSIYFPIWAYLARPMPRRSLFSSQSCRASKWKPKSCVKCAGLGLGSCQPNCEDKIKRT